MGNLLERFLERPLWQKLAVWVGSLGLVGFLFWNYYYGEKRKTFAELEEKVSNLNTQIHQEQRLARNLPKFEKEVDELDKKFRIAVAELPDKREIPDLIISISNLARDSGLLVTLFKPNPEVRKEFYAEVPVSVSVEGTFHQVATFFDEVGQLPRIVNINQISLGGAKVLEDRISIKADYVTTAFRSLDESERIAPPKEAANSKRRKKK